MTTETHHQIIEEKAREAGLEVRAMENVVLGHLWLEHHAERHDDTKTPKGVSGWWQPILVLLGVLFLGRFLYLSQGWPLWHCILAGLGILGITLLAHKYGEAPTII